MKSYAGIGSRDCSWSIELRIAEIARTLTNKGYILRSGGASGSDAAFEFGCDEFDGDKEIYLPEKGFRNNPSELYLDNLPARSYMKALGMAMHYNSHWNTLSPFVQKLKIRNCFQIFGESMDNPVDFVVCYTINGKPRGGTGMNINIAKDHNIPVYNLFYPEVENFIKLLD